MTKVLLGLGFVLVVAVAMVAGAGLHTWLDDVTKTDDATKTADFQHTDDPLLTRAQVKLLVYTFLFEQVGPTKGIADLCYPTHALLLTGLASGDRLQDFEFEYVGNKLWLVSNERCIIRVSDATGKVSAP